MKYSQRGQIKRVLTIESSSWNRSLRRRATGGHQHTSPHNTPNLTLALVEAVETANQITCQQLTREQGVNGVICGGFHPLSPMARNSLEV